MVIDTSSLIAILLNESERAAFNQAIETAESRIMSVVSFVEASIVIESRLGPEGLMALDLLIAKAGIDLVSVDADQAHTARNAFRLFGKGRHPAGLNFGDCFAYALARERGEPLLFKGSDFSLTDVESALGASKNQSRHRSTTIHDSGADTRSD